MSGKLPSRNETRDKLRECLGMDKGGALAWCNWRLQHGGLQAPHDLSDIGLSGRTVEKYNFENCRFDRGSLHHTDFVRCNFVNASVKGANLRGTRIARSFTHGMDREGANVEGLVEDCNTEGDAAMHGGGTYRAVAMEPGMVTYEKTPEATSLPEGWRARRVQS